MSSHSCRFVARAARPAPLNGNMLTTMSATTPQQIPLEVHVRPSAAAGKARLQRKTGGRWADFKTVSVKDGRGGVRLPKGTHVLRAWFPGGAVNAAGISRAYTIRVK